MRALIVLTLILGLAAPSGADEPPVVHAKPGIISTLVNPSCSHCVDEAKRRAKDLTPEDPILVWTRGYSEGGAIPLRFFLNAYRVISDSYGVFVYDPEAGFARGFAPSYQFEFDGWRNGILVMKHQDGTLFSALSGAAFAGPRKGERLTPVPTLRSTWGHWMELYPNAVTYEMSEKYQPLELPKSSNVDSIRSRPRTTDPRLKPDETVLGVRIGDQTRAIPRTLLNTTFLREDKLGDTRFVLFRNANGAVGAYRYIASPPRKFRAPNPDKTGVSPPDSGQLLVDAKPRTLSGFQDSKLGPLDHETGTAWDVAGRGRHGPLKGWTLEPIEAIECKWFAWAAEYPQTEVQTPDKVQTAPVPPTPMAEEVEKEIAGTAEFLRLLPKPFATLKSFDKSTRTVTLLFDGEKIAKTWPLEPDAEIKVQGWWGRLEQFRPEQRVWVWLKLDRKKNPVSVCLLADEASERDMHDQDWLVFGVDADSQKPGILTFTLTAGQNKKVVATGDANTMATIAPGTQIQVQIREGKIARFQEMSAVEAGRLTQRKWLREQWAAHGLPGTLTFHHVFSGELEIMLDHESMRWGRALKKGEIVHLNTDPAIKAVVRDVTPWRDRTNVRLVVGELESSELKVGQRLGLRVPLLPLEIDMATEPPDLDRPRTPAQRVEWFLASLYCVCGVGNDTCTGHVYTLASCNPNGCGAPAMTRKTIETRIQQGKTDRQIWDELLTARGSLMLRPHLRP